MGGAPVGTERPQPTGSRARAAQLVTHHPSNCPKGLAMPKTKWWLRLVGGFYIFLALTSVWVLFINPQLFGSMFPFSADQLSIRAFSDAWLIFVLEMAVLGVIMLYASQNPARNGILVA